MHKGRCECGAVAFEIKGEISDPSICHCKMCQRLSGHVWAGAWAPIANFTFTRKGGLKWYRSSDWAERGFCDKCGASLFYHLLDNDNYSVGVGCLDAPTGLKLKRHIYVADKGDYYEIADTLPKLKTY